MEIYKYFISTDNYETIEKWSKILFDQFKYIKYFNTSEKIDGDLEYQIVIYSNWDCLYDLRNQLNTDVYLYFEHQ